MPAPRRILVAVEPRLLSDLLRELLADIGLDEVVQAGAEVPDDHFDLALINDGSPAVRADLVLRVPDSTDLAATGPGDLRPGSALELLTILDRVCPAAEPRSGRLPHAYAAGGAQ